MSGIVLHDLATLPLRIAREGRKKQKKEEDYGKQHNNKSLPSGIQ